MQQLVLSKKSEKIVSASILFSILTTSAMQFGGEVWRSKIFVGLVFAAIFISVQFVKKIHWTAGLCVFSTIISAMSVFNFPKARYSGPSSASFDAQAADAIFYFLMITVPFLFASKHHFSTILKALSWLCLADSAFVIAQRLWGFQSYDCGGFFGNASTNACLIAFTYPVLAFMPESRRIDFDTPTILVRRPFEFLFVFVSVVFPVVAILFSGSSMALGTLAVCTLTATFYSSSKPILRRFAIAGIILGLICFIGVLLLGAELVNDSDRLGMWALVLQWWDMNANHWFGTGLGSYFLIGPHIQKLNHFREGHWWIWLHNDWLQLLFEQGIVGLAAFLLLFVCALRACQKTHNVWLLSAIAGFAFTALGNYPARLMVHSFIGVAYCAIAFHEYYGGSYSETRTGKAQVGQAVPNKKVQESRMRKSLC